MDPTLVTALKNVLLNHLRNSGSGNATGNNDVLLSRLLSASLAATPSPPHTPSPNLISGVRTPPGTTSAPLSRTSSGASSASGSSLSRTTSGASSASDSSLSRTTSGASRRSVISSRHEWDDNNDDDDDFVVKRRKPPPRAIETGQKSRIPSRACQTGLTLSCSTSASGKYNVSQKV